VAVLATVLSWLPPREARAQDQSGWISNTLRQQCIAERCWRYKHWQPKPYREWRRVHRYRVVAPPPVYRRPHRDYYDDDNYDGGRRGHVFRDDKPSHKCVSEIEEVVSTEHQSEDNAREAARKLWMARVQWRHGGQYMNLEEADEVRWQCGPSNAHDTFSSRLAEGTAKLIGREGQNVRCELWARPCRAGRERGRGER
jgi:hypothetical protein